MKTFIEVNVVKDVELAALDADKGIAIELKHDDKLDESAGAAVQIALLYTSVFGERRLRIHNLQVLFSKRAKDSTNSSLV